MAPLSVAWNGLREKGFAPHPRLFPDNWQHPVSHPSKKPTDSLHIVVLGPTTQEFLHLKVRTSE